MEPPFLKLTAEYICEHYKDKIDQLCIVLPNKRGALFLKKFLAQAFGKTIWLPTIISAEELISDLSGLQVPEEIDLICHLYESYKTCYGNDAEPFDSFAKWGQLILQDFNEIDRYLADPKQIYENLREIKVIENWSLGAEVLTEHQSSYLRFMGSLGAIYSHYSNFLLANNWGYQGLAYRVAADKADPGLLAEKFHKIIFCGFNALNAAEIKIFSKLHKAHLADLLWDADEYYLKDKTQEAGMFVRKNLEIFQQKDISFIGQHFQNPKNIKVVSVPKQMGQAQVVKQALQQLTDRGVTMDKVAVILANEKLLWPVLHQLPEGIGPVNITMEYPLRYTAAYDLIDQLIQLQNGFEKQKNRSKTIYHSDLLNLLRQPLFAELIKSRNIHINISKVINELTARNLSFLTGRHLSEIFKEEDLKIRPLLQPASSVQVFTEIIVQLLEDLINVFAKEEQNNKKNLELEYLHIILRQFNRLTEILQRYPHFNSISSFRHLFQQIVGSSTAPFIGEPLQGLQIMGVLETRTLDFEYIIMVNVNEGVLPSGKTINSFIPNDLKRAFGLPLYIEKDSIYAYHFYRILQRAKEAVITYDSETDTFGKGEKSRFITQLQLEIKKYNPEITITEEVASYPALPAEQETIIAVEKTTPVLHNILEKAGSIEKYGGLSPSGLIMYKECPLKFYFRYGAKLKELKEIEESAEAGTFGSILHLALEKIYTDFKGKVISKEALQDKRHLLDAVVEESFISFFDNNKPSGKSILQQEVIKVYVRKLVDNDLKFIGQLSAVNHVLTLRALEEEFTAPLTVNISGQTFKHYIKGKIDRIDAYGSFVRVIDYKSSVKDSDKFIFEGFEKLFSDTNYNKQLQLVLYAWLLFKNNISKAEQLRPCVIPFKVFTEEPRYILGTDKKPFFFSEQFFEDFEAELSLFVSSVFDNTIPFSQTTDDKIHEFCPYNKICNIKD